MRKAFLVIVASAASLSNVFGQDKHETEITSDVAANHHDAVVNDLSHLPGLSSDVERELFVIFSETALEETRIRREMEKAASSLQGRQLTEQEAEALLPLFNQFKEQLRQNSLKCDARVALLLTPEQMAIYRERGQRWELK